MKWFLFSLLLAISTGSFAGERVLTPKDVARIKRVTDAELSPDGQAIAYTLEVQRELFVEENGKPWVELHVWRDGLGTVPFVTGQVNVREVRWRPDGKHISFLAKRDGDKDTSLYLIPLSGGEATRILSHATAIRKYEWAGPSEIVFTAKEPKNSERERFRKLGFNQDVYEEGLQQICVYTARLGEETSVHQLELKGSAFDISVSPDGKMVAVGLSPTPLVDDSYVYKRLHVINTGDGSLVRKIENPGKLSSVRWSPDGKRLAMISAADQHDPKEGRLFVADLSGKLEKYLMEEKGHVRKIAWKDQETVHYLWDEGVETRLRTLKLGDSKGEAPMNDVPLTFPALSYASSRLALVGDSPSHPNELFLWEEGQSTAQRITHSNPWLEEVRLAPQEVVTYKARDGLELQGILIRPLDEQPGKKYPLILVVHGGPESHYRNGWITDYARLGQMAAARGFAVFMPNYRASTGRGVAFSKLDHGRPAMEEFNDLVDAVHYLSRDMGLADEKKVGITGGSYGGYATAWCSTALSEHFAAAVMFVGISNKISKAGTSDIPDEVYLVHDRHRLWEDWDLFLKQSPIYHVEKAKTPLLIMHGKKDTRVPPSQSLELYRHLKVLGKTPVRLVWYPDEQHGNKEAAARYDYCLRAMRWFQHYLQGPGGEKPPMDVPYEME